MKCSVQSITAGDAAYAAERDRLQKRGGAGVTRDPLLREPPRAPRRPSAVEMLTEGLRGIDAQNAGSE